MSGRALWAAVAVAIVAAITAVFLWSQQTESSTVEAPFTESDSTSEAGALAPESTRPGGDKKEEGSRDPQDRNDMPAVDLGVTTGRTSFGCDVNALAEEFGSNFNDDARDERFADYLRVLSASGDAEHQLAALQLLQAEVPPNIEEEEYPQMQVDRLALALQIDPVNPVVLWNAATACLEPDLYSFCSDVDLQENLRLVLGSNGEYWAQESARLYLMEDRDGALDALRRAASAPTFDSYFMEHVRIHQRALSLIPDTAPVEGAFAAYALSLTTIENGVRGLAGCFFEVTDPSWLDVCTAVANRYASETPTIMQRGFGMETLARIYEAAGQTEAATLERQRVAELGESLWIEDEDKIAVMVTDERVMAAYLNELEAGDELSAARYLDEEIERLMQDPSYTPCPEEEISD